LLDTPHRRAFFFLADSTYRASSASCKSRRIIRMSMACNLAELLRAANQVSTTSREMRAVSGRSCLPRHTPPNHRGQTSRVVGEEVPTFSRWRWTGEQWIGADVPQMPRSAPRAGRLDAVTDSVRGRPGYLRLQPTATGAQLDDGRNAAASGGNVGSTTPRDAVSVCLSLMGSEGC
jgi:hypothetical protein